MTREEVVYNQESKREAELDIALKNYPEIICDFFSTSFLNSDRKDKRFDMIYGKVLNGEITTIKQIENEWEKL